MHLTLYSIVASIIIVSLSYFLSEVVVKLLVKKEKNKIKIKYSLTIFNVVMLTFIFLNTIINNKF